MEEGLVVARDNKLFYSLGFAKRPKECKGEGGGRMTKKITDQRTANMGGGGGWSKQIDRTSWGINQIFVLTQLKSSNPSLPPHPGDR